MEVDVSGFSDLVLLRLADPDQLANALAPAGAPPPARLGTILTSVFDLSSVRIERIDEVLVREVVLERPLFPVERQLGTWTGVVPTHSRSDLVLDRSGPTDPVWVDLLGTVVLRVVVEIEPGDVEAVTVEEIEGYQTLDEFRSRFRYLDLDAFMKQHGLKTVEDLREAYHYLRTELKLAAPPAFDPDDPANRLDVEAPLAVLVHDELDITATLRAAKLVRALAEGAVAALPRDGLGERTAPYAIAALFPRTALPAGGPSEDDVHALFAREGVLSLFLGPA
jgi:hypothetical protein